MLDKSVCGHNDGGKHTYIYILRGKGEGLRVEPCGTPQTISQLDKMETNKQTKNTS